MRVSSTLGGNTCEAFGGGGGTGIDALERSWTLKGGCYLGERVHLAEKQMSKWFGPVLSRPSPKYKHRPSKWWRSNPREQSLRGKSDSPFLAREAPMLMAHR